MKSDQFRREHDFLGDRDIPSEALYGIQTLRALENFNITGLPVSREPLLIKSFAFVKKAAAMANRDCGILSNEITEAIIYGCDQLITGKHLDQFITDMIQGGAGTSCNMNVNEVIANLGLEHMGYQRGEYQYLHPNNHVNCSQSTNDAYPTAFRIALHRKIDSFIEAMEQVRAAFAAKGEEFKDVLKMGRTQLQDAVPMTLGAEFTAYATTIGEDIQRMREVQSLVTEINMGATAIGTRINTPDGYADKVTSYLSALTGMPLTLSPDLIEATVDTGAYLQISGTMKRCAVKLSKICNDLRLLSSGPRTGFGEINLPQMQPGSSIMPGKVNPVIPEVVNQVCFYVVGCDSTITMACEAGQLQLNVMEPVIAFSMFSALEYMKNACTTLSEKCIPGITANVQTCYDHVMNSIGIVTSLNPILGYEKCSEIAREALHTGKTIHTIVVLEQNYITQEKWDEIYSVENLIRPKFIV
jgi:aspartate ammonia-lyase